MTGGADEPCVPRHMILKIQQDPRRVCPRVELSDENALLSDVAWFAVKLGGDHPLFEKLFDLVTEGLDPDQRISVFYRIVSAVSDPGVAARIKAERDRRLKQE